MNVFFISIKKLRDGEEVINNSLFFGLYDVIKILIEITKKENLMKDISYTSRKQVTYDLKSSRLTVYFAYCLHINKK